MPLPIGLTTKVKAKHLLYLKWRRFAISASERMIEYGVALMNLPVKVSLD